MQRFEFTGVVTLRWHDPRQAFDPAEDGSDEKVFQGAYQLDEIAPGWYPQVIRANEAGLFQTSGVVLRVKRDGTMTLIATLNAAAKSGLNMRRFLSDVHRPEAILEFLGFDHEEVVFTAVDTDSSGSTSKQIEVPWWNVSVIEIGVWEQSAAYAGARGVTSSFTLSVEVHRKPFYILRLVVFPLFTIVILSFCVLWMNRSSLGDRISVSFISVLTRLAYQIS